MWAESKPEPVARVEITVHVEYVGVGEHVFVPIGGLIRGNDTLSSTYELLSRQQNRPPFAYAIPDASSHNTYLSTELHIFLGHSLHGHGGTGVVAA